ncbi:MAG TPA: glycosyltransferase family 39 protein [Gemmataceae bacterium]|jgi:4-amino-4-deoxy-L-arabinose transferase-like glycosyltransferase|nr:glycosyltransferase family 39 protein [Gemmataceae bacterium]
MDADIFPRMDWLYRFGFAAVLVLAAVLFGARLGERSLWSEEVRWAEIPREMEQTGRYFWPTINGKPYYDKPLGSYWLVLAAAHITGNLDEAAARWPCAVAGWLSVWLVMLIAKRLYSPTTAIISGLVLATSFSIVFFSRNASSDMETVAGNLAVLWLFLRNEKNPGGWWTLLFWLLMALTSLTKGLLGFALPLLVIGAYQTFTASQERSRQEQVQRPSLTLPARILFERNRWFFNWKTPLGIALALIVYFSPFLATTLLIGEHDGLAMVFRENIRRFYNPVNHRGPMYLYLYVIFGLLAPWSVLLPAALWHGHATWRADDSEQRSRRFALIYFWSVFLFFTLAASRRSYYLLPVLPAAALLIGQLLANPWPSLRPTARWLLVGGGAILAVIVFVSGLALLTPQRLLPPAWKDLPALPYPMLFGLGWVACLIAVGFAFWKREPKRWAAAFGVIATWSMAYIFLIALPATESYRTRKPFAEAVHQQLLAEPGTLAFFRHRESVFYLEVADPVPEYESVEPVLNAIQRGQIRWLVACRGDVESFRNVGNIRLSETEFPWEPSDQKRAKLVLLECAP